MNTTQDSRTPAKKRQSALNIVQQSARQIPRTSHEIAMLSHSAELHKPGPQACVPQLTALCCFARSAESLLSCRNSDSSLRSPVPHFNVALFCPKVEFVI